MSTREVSCDKCHREAARREGRSEKWRGKGEGLGAGKEEGEHATVSIDTVSCMEKLGEGEISPGSMDRRKESSQSRPSEDTLNRQG